METAKLSPINQNIITKEKEAKEKVQNTPEQKKNGKKLLAAGAAAVAAVVVAGIAISKGKIKSLDDINFKEGIATLKKGGKKFSGKIKTTLPNGDKVTMSYINGVLQKSTRTGSKNISKTFSVNEKGEKIIEIIKDGKSEIKNISAISKAVKEDQARLNELLDSSKDISFEEFKQEASKIKYCTKSQKEQIVKSLKKQELKPFVETEAEIRTLKAEAGNFYADSYQAMLRSQQETNLSHKSAQESAEIIERLKEIEPSFLDSLDDERQNLCVNILHNQNIRLNFSDEEIEKLLDLFARSTGDELWPISSKIHYAIDAEDSSVVKAICDEIKLLLYNVGKQQKKLPPIKATWHYV